MNAKLIQEEFDAEEDAVVTETAVVVATPAAVAVPAPRALATAADKGYIEGMEGLSASDFSIPRYKIIQAMTKDDIPEKLKHVGEWFNTVDGECLPELEVALLKAGKTRVMFPKGDFSGNALCRSSDGIVPDKQFEGVYSAICETCEYGKWGEDGEKPPCQSGYTYLGVDMNNDLMPFMMTWASTANKIARQLNTKLRGMGRRRGAMRANIVTLGSRLIKNAQGEWYVPTYAVSPIDDDALLAELRELHLAYAHIALEADETVAENGENVAGDDGEAAPF